MRKLIFVLLAFLAVFTYIRAFPYNEDGESDQSISVRAQNTIEVPIYNSNPAIPVEILR
jgi:hypothetical protein